MKPEDLFIGAIVQNPLGGIGRVVNIRLIPEDSDGYGGYYLITLAYSKSGESYANIQDKDIRPVSITPEILEKNGFKKCNEDADGAIQYEFGSKNLGVDIWTPGSMTESYLLGAWNKWPECIESYSMINEMPIRYVHQLQAALRLCGIEKEIEL